MQRIPVAREIMFSPVRITQPEMDIYDAMELLYQRDAPAAMVQDETGCVAGILTEKDCLRVLSAEAYEGQGVMHSGTVADYMSPLKTILTPDMDLFSISAAFLQTNFTWLPVVEGHTLLGCISRKDMLRQIRALEKAVLDRRGTDAEWQKALMGGSSLMKAQFMVARTRR